MAKGADKLLVGFLEKDNLKLLTYEISGREARRVFAGQITFASDIVKDAFIADSARFSSQVKVAFAQKPQLSEPDQVLLFIHPDKIFTKTLPMSESDESFVRGLPYFKEELLISPSAEDRAAKRGVLKGSSKGEERVNYLAFEKKLVEDFQRPFLESGKKVVSVQSGLNVLAAVYPADGKYFLLAPFDKEIGVAAVTDGGIDEVAIFSKEVFASRFSEFVVGRNLKEVKRTYTFGAFDQHIAEKIRAERSLSIESLASGDIYDVVTGGFLKMTAKGGLSGFLSTFNFSALGRIFSGRKFFLIAAVLVGAVLTFVIVKNFRGLPSLRLPGGSGSAKVQTAVKPTTPAPPPAPEPKPSDYKVRILNGTLVTGEAGSLGDKIKGMGFDVVEAKNATSAGFVTTRLRVSSDVPQKIRDMLKSTLSDLYDAVIVEPFTDPAVKIEIIIGKKKS